MKNAELRMENDGRVALPFFVSGLICLSLFLSSCSQASTGEFVLSVDNFYGVEGYTLHYDVSPKEARVRLTDDFGSPERVLWQDKMSSQQANRASKCLCELPLNELENEYDNPNVCDGLQLTFRIQLENSAMRTIVLRNKYQKDLFAIVDLINQLVPGEYAIKFDQGAVIIGAPE